eukprot:jgi/Galph1/4775/GphlegSOOS_G3428.1
MLSKDSSSIQALTAFVDISKPPMKWLFPFLLYLLAMYQLRVVRQLHSRKYLFPNHANLKKFRFLVCRLTSSAPASSYQYSSGNICTNIVSSNSPTVPNIVHFVYGLEKDPPFGLVEHLIVLATVRRIQPDKVYFHYCYTPKGVWWEHTKPLLTLNQVMSPVHVFGNPLNNVAHKADVVRLQVLSKYGGIYLDMDVLPLKKFDELRQFPMVLGQEGVNGNIGLANAVIIAHPSSAFLQQWFLEYRHFNDLVWNWFSVRLPKIMATEMPEEICVLNHTAFFDPLWTEDGIRELYYRDTGKDYSTGHYAVHFWGAEFKHGWENFTVSDIMKGPGIFHRLMRNFMDENNEIQHLIDIEKSK